MELGDIKNSFSGRLKDCRRKLKLKQADLAKIVGISKGTIQNYEAGQLPKGEHLIKLSKALKCSTDWLLKGKGANLDISNDKKPTYQHPEEGYGAGTISSPDKTYNKIKISDMVSRTVEILESDTIYKYALASNINAFHHAIMTNIKMEKMEERVVVLESRCADLEKRLVEAEKEVRLYKNTAAQG